MPHRARPRHELFVLLSIRLARKTKRTLTTSDGSAAPAPSSMHQVCSGPISSNMETMLSARLWAAGQMCTPMTFAGSSRYVSPPISMSTVLDMPPLLTTAACPSAGHSESGAGLALSKAIMSGVSPLPVIVLASPAQDVQVTTTS